MPRVIAGVAGGRRLAVPPGTGTRPTSDRAREGLFSSWEAQLGGSVGWRGLRMLDLYGGSGAVGLEALSRGASHVLFAEPDPRAVRTLRANARGLGLEGAEIHAARAGQLLRAKAPGEPYGLAFLDPPYALSDDAVREILVTLRSAGWLTADALVTVERGSRGGEFRWPDGFEGIRRRRYGEGTLWYGHAAREVTEPSC